MSFGSMGSGQLWNVPGAWIWEPKVIGFPGVGWESGSWEFSRGHLG